MFKITAYGVRKNEKEYFEKLNKYNYDLNLIEDLLTHDNINTAKGSDAVLLRGNCVGDETNLSKLNEWGIKYVFTRTVGLDHIDLNAVKKFDMKVARVPGYSPYAVAELSLTLGMILFRKVSLAITNTLKHNFKVDLNTFSNEIHSGVVGIIGTGKIGLTEAKLYKNMGVKVLGYDPYPTDYAKEIVEFTSLTELLQQSDIISLHVPYIKGENDNLIGKDELKLMKDNAVLVNTARSEVVDYKSVYDALVNHKIYGLATDVLPNEREIFGKNFDGSSTENQLVDDLCSLYPRVIMTPHIGSYTEPALKDMISVSYENFHQTLTQGYSDNDVK